MVSQIRDEAYNNSKVMETLAQLTDVLGPRLTGSPAAKQANEWTRQQLATWDWRTPTSRPSVPSAVVGASSTPPSTRCAVHRSPHCPAKAWTPGTEGPVRGKVVKAKLESEADLEKSKGTLAGEDRAHRGRPRAARARQSRSSGATTSRSCTISPSSRRSSGAARFPRRHAGGRPALRPRGRSQAVPLPEDAPDLPGGGEGAGLGSSPVIATAESCAWPAAAPG